MGRLKQIRSEVRQALDLKNRVFLKLKNQNFPVFKKLSINVNLDRVIISGTVRSFYERQIAINTVRQVAGVINLTDKITVVS